MPEPILNCSRVVAGVGQSIAAGVPQHVDVNFEGKTGALADALDEARLTASVVNGVPRSVSKT
jgi:hypothetical protein